MRLTVPYDRAVLTVDGRVLTARVPSPGAIDRYLARDADDPAAATLELLAGVLDPPDYDALYATHDHSTLREIAVHLLGVTLERFCGGDAFDTIVGVN